MDSFFTTNTDNLGKKVEKIRRLRGLSQQELADLLNITKQAVSKIEQSEKISHERLTDIAKALGVTLEGLKNLNEENINYNSYNFYENCGVNSASIGANHIETINHFPIEQTIKFFEELLAKEKERFVAEKKSK
jgi:transcriptional regulator with XRE-family HTH domain